MFQQPDPKAMAEEERDRSAREAAAAGQLSGRTIRAERNQQIGLKTTREKKDQFDRLRLMTRWSYVQVFESALDALEQAWKEGKIK
jgi:hypothetical protein